MERRAQARPRTRLSLTENASFTSIHDLEPGKLLNCGLWFYHLTFCHVNSFWYILLRQQTGSLELFLSFGGLVNLFRRFCCFVVLSSAISPLVHAQGGASAEAPRPLVLTEAIATPGVQGRFDHFRFDGKNQLFVAALGNNTVEVIDISARVRSHTITGIPNPQGVAYAPDAKKLFVASSKGKLRIYAGENFDLVKEIDFHGDVDNLRYDPATHRVYVGFGEDETGAIGIVDATTNERLPEEYKLG